MAAYLVMTPPASGDRLRDAERVAFVKDGFSWPALLIPLLWAIYHRLWLVLLGLIAAMIGIELLARYVDDRAGLIAGALFSILFALEANFLRRWTLRRRGWRLADIVVGSNPDDYERRFFEGWLEAGDAPRQATGGTAVTLGPVADDTGVIGLFPQPEGAR